MENKDAVENRYIAYLSYFSLLFLVPMYARKNSDFCKFHVSQGKALFLFQIILLLLDLLLKLFTKQELNIAFLTIFGYILSVSWIYYFTMIVFGVLNITKGLEKRLPLVWRLWRGVK